MVKAYCGKPWKSTQYQFTICKYVELVKKNKENGIWKFAIDISTFFEIYFNLQLLFKLLRKWNKEMSYENNENLFKLMQF